MGKTIHYYNCFVKHNDQYTNIFLNDLVDRIIPVDATLRFKAFSKLGNICLIDVQAPNQGQEINGRPVDYRIRKSVIAKYRENKPYLGNIGTDRLDEIQDDVLEATSIVFFPNSYLAAIEYNHNGAKVKAIEEYLSSFLPYDNQNEWSVKFHPIESGLGFNDLRDSNKIQNIEIKLDLNTDNQNLFTDETGYQSVLGDIIGNTLNVNNDLNVNTATISFGNGRFRNRQMDNEGLVRLLSILDLQNNLFEAVRVRYKSPTTHRSETIDLKNESILKSILEVDDNASWELITNQILGLFYSDHRVGDEAHIQYEKVIDEIPHLVFNEIANEE